MAHVYLCKQLLDQKQIEAMGKEPNTVQLKEFIFGKESSKA